MATAEDRSEVTPPTAATKADDIEGGQPGGKPDESGSGSSYSEEYNEAEDLEDVEDTLEEEEALAEADADDDEEDELAGLEADAETPLEELLARYGGSGAKQPDATAEAAEAEAVEAVADENGDNPSRAEEEDDDELDPDYAVPAASAATIWLPKEPRVGAEFQAEVPDTLAKPGDAATEETTETAAEAAAAPEESESALPLTEAELSGLESGLAQEGKKFWLIRERHLPELPVPRIVAGYYRWKATSRGREFLDRLREQRRVAAALAVAAAAAAADFGEAESEATHGDQNGSDGARPAGSDDEAEYHKVAAAE